MIRLKTVCVDDELPSLKLLKEYSEMMPDIELLRTFSNPKEAIAFLEKTRVDLLLLDIRMPGFNGLELLQQLTYKPLCIFITADMGFAVQAYELDVIDYLIKPVPFVRFEKSVNKAIEYKRFTAFNAADEHIIMFKSDYMIQRMRLADILWVEGFGEYIKLVGRFKNFTLLQRMSEFAEQYAYLGFIRIHKSYLVLAQDIESYSSSMVKLKLGHELPVGRVYKQNVQLRG
ncbi:LytR/AlgR family response regulator transcription factor [Pedobacter cryoconitis]|uniref:DNA-binding LytR/AlgR family response regulator n=1 Tax=Pedobacter cryoconitis TaxID=188932 RepID=A0A7X0MK55_9SPHI|nr:LytTR family DNA-binding domain-containing protein [Pedobacter cryoconitis]MBB6502202.1 DNA-binding LytR/AlgR family response regulator [Pedobacter cryoconitis]